MKIIERAIVVWVVLISAATAWGGDGFENPVPQDTMDWPAVAIAVIGLAAIGVLGFKNAKRSHLD